MDRRGAFDYVLLETTGLADPGNLAPLFWVDEGLGSSIYLDGIVTVVDARNVLKALSEPSIDEDVNSEVHAHSGPLLTTAHLQISHADVVLLNKIDLVSTEELQSIELRLRSINGLAKVHATTHSRIPDLSGVILDLHAYDDVSTSALEFASKGHSHLDPAIGTLALTLPVLDINHMESLDLWLRAALWDRKLLGFEHDQATWEIYRIKGRIVLKDGTVKVLQGVREIFELVDGKHDTESADSESGKIVLIGRNIASQNTGAMFRRSLDDCLAR